MFAALYALGGASGPCVGDFLTFDLLLATAATLAMFCGLDSTGAWWVAAIVAVMPAVYSGSHAAFVHGLLYGTFMILKSQKDVLHAALVPSYAERIRAERIPFSESFEYLHIPGISSSSQALAAAKQLGITHVLDVTSGVGPFQVEDHGARLRLVFETTNQRIYLVE
jgi:hypothetical protein